jgi:hypothetical protein
MSSPCVLHATLGQLVACPEDGCALWEDGCAVKALKPDLHGQGLARYLLDLRERLEQLRAA